MRKFKILKWPDGVGFMGSIDISKPFRLIKEFKSSVCLDVEGQRMYFYHNEVKEVTNE